jgi:putative transposase
MDASWCTQVLKEAVEQHGKPEIINIDHGSKFTSDQLTSMARSNNINLSIDGKDRAIDNVFIERL